MDTLGDAMPNLSQCEIMNQNHNNQNQQKNYIDHEAKDEKSVGSNVFDIGQIISTQDVLLDGFKSLNVESSQDENGLCQYSSFLCLIISTHHHSK